MFTETRFEGNRPAHSAHKDRSFTSFPFTNKTRQESKPATSPFDIVKFLASHVQRKMAAQGYLRHLPVLQEEGNSIVSPDPCSPTTNNASLPTLFSLELLDETEEPLFRPPGILLGHHVQTDQGTCFHCFGLGCWAKTNQLPEDHRLFLQKEMKSSPYGPYLPGTFHCVKVVRRRTLSHATRTGQKNSSHNGSIRPDITRSQVIAALLPQSLEPTSVLTLKTL